MNRKKSFFIVSMIFLVLSILFFISSYTYFSEYLITFIENKIKREQLYSHPNSLKHQQKIFQTLPIISFSYGILFLLLSLSSFFLLKTQTFHNYLRLSYLKKDLIHFSCQIISFFKLRSLKNNEVYLIILFILIGFYNRVIYLNQYIGYDESVSYLNYVNQSFPFLFLYNVPNNHILNSIFMKVSTSIFGQSLIAIRLPALLSGIFMMPLIYFISKNIFKNNTGIISLFYLSISPVMIYYSTTARGYSLLIVIILIIIIIGYCLYEKITISGILFFSLFSALGFFTIPIMLIPFSGVLFWLILRFKQKDYLNRDIILKLILPLSIISIIFCALLYTPVIIISGGIENIINNKYVQPYSVEYLVTNIFNHFINIIKYYFEGIPSAVNLIFILFLFFGFYEAFKNSNYNAISLVLSFLLSIIIIIIFKRILPWNRVLLFLIPFILIISDSGFSYFNRKLKYKNHGYWLLILLSLTFSHSLHKTNSIQNQDRESFIEAQRIANFLSLILEPNDRIYTTIPADYPIRFYLNQKGFGSQLWYNIDNVNNTYLINLDKFYTIDYLTKEKTIKLKTIGNATIYKVQYGV